MPPDTPLVTSPHSRITIQVIAEDAEKKLADERPLPPGYASREDANPLSSCVWTVTWYMLTWRAYGNVGARLASALHKEIDRIEGASGSECNTVALMLGHAELAQLTR